MTIRQVGLGLAIALVVLTSMSFCSSGKPANFNTVMVINPMITSSAEDASEQGNNIAAFN